MTSVIHERPGVYSDYDASSVSSAGHSTKSIGVAAIATQGETEKIVPLTSYEEGIAIFGEDAANTPGMANLLHLLFANGAVSVLAVRVADGTLASYEASFALLEQAEEPYFLLCDSADLTIQQALRESVIRASNARKERIAIVGGNGETVSESVTRAAALNHERVLLVAPDMQDHTGATLPAVFAAAAVAAAISCESDPSIPINGMELMGFSGVTQKYSDNDIDLLVQGGVTPLECVSGVVSPVRGITTKTTNGGVPDVTWRELTTIFIIDDVIPEIRNALRSRFLRSKNTTQTRGAIRSQVLLMLETKLTQERIDSYSDVTVAPMPSDPTVCLVEFGFTVAHGLNRIFLTAHITV